jgi:hypothetical protein
MKRTLWLFFAIILLLPAQAQCASLAVVDSLYRPDIAFPQFDRYWGHKPSAPDAKPGDKLAGIVMIYVHNTSEQPVAVEDVTMQGVSLSQAIAFDKSRLMRHYIYPANMHYSKLPQSQLDKLRALGDPIWWRFDPQVLQPGGFGELAIRLRHQPSSRMEFRILTKGGEGLDVGVAAGGAIPRFEAIRCIPGSDTAYVYTSFPQKGIAPRSLALDGIDITANTKILSDSAVGVTPLVCRLNKPLVLGSVHFFQAVFPDGRKASALVRVFEDFFAYGMWGARKTGSGDTELAKFHLNDLALHNINVQMEMLGSDAMKDFMVTDEGQRAMKSLGIRCEIAEVGKWGCKDPWAFFVADEPDAGDAHTKGIPTQDQLGTLANGVYEKTQRLHKEYPLAPGLVNVDCTFTPLNYYVYGQTADILGSDPYYQARIGQETKKGTQPEKLDAYKKATYIEGVSAICSSSQAPKPVHITLLAGGGIDNGQKYAPPQIKRIEAYYAIGGGATGLSYWWFYGLDKGVPPLGNNPAAVAQWTELGLLGAELRTAGSLITTSCRAPIAVKAPKDFWVRSLIHGDDTVVLVCVNDAYTCDINGINIKPMKNVELQVALPKWLNAKTVFEVNYKGVHEVPTVFDPNKSTAAIRLGDVDVTKLVVITSDTGLMSRLEKTYNSQFAENVKKLLAHR